MEPSAQACIPAVYSRLMAQELGLRTTHLTALLAGTAITPEELLDEETRLTPDQQIQIVRNALRLSGEPSFGVRLGRRLTPAVHGPMGFVASSSPDLATALEAVEQFAVTQMPLWRVTYDRGQDVAVMRFRLTADVPAEVVRFLAEVSTMALYAIAEFISGRVPDTAEINFTHPDPGPRAGYHDHLPGRLRYSCPDFEIRLPAELCEIPNASANRDTYLLAWSQCEALLAELQSPQLSMRRQIETMMLTHPTGSFTEDDAAAALFMSKRTLARRLNDEGASFRQIKDDVLAGQARRYLRDERMTVQSVADLLHYHDSANFRRAFKRWCGMTPEAYRRNTADVVAGALRGSAHQPDEVVSGIPRTTEIGCAKTDSWR